MTGSCACAGPTGDRAPCACARPTDARAKAPNRQERHAFPPSQTIGSFAPPSVAATLASAGEPLDAVLRGQFESRFGASLRDVRVHTDGGAARSAADVGARAYTVANDVVFARGAYSPGTDDGRRLIAHELVHVLQQRPGVAPSGAALRIDDSGEAAAVRGADAPSQSITRSLVRRAPAVQRQPATTPPTATAAKPLNKKQELDAINYYLTGPRIITPRIMRQIQHRLGVPATGVADSATVQAVAAFQQTQAAGSNPLRVDGKAASRTLSRLFPSGLNAPGEAESYGKEVQANVLDKWAKLTADQRAQELIRLVNVHLAKAGIPAVAAATTSPPAGVSGGFTSKDWAVALDPATLSTAPTLGESVDLGEAVYHEARHAEQAFRAAQMRSLALRKARTGAEDARLAKAIHAELGISIDVARVAAEKDRSLTKIESLIAEDWYQALVLRSLRLLLNNLVERMAMDALNNCLAAEAQNAAHPTKENQAELRAAADEWAFARNQYHGPASENDAFATGKPVAAGIKRGVVEGPDPLGPCGTPPDP